MEEWISLTEYMKRYHIGFKEAKKMINNNEIEYRQTDGGHYKIKVNGNMVSRDIYEKERERRIQAETKLNLLKNIFNEGVEINED